MIRTAPARSLLMLICIQQTIDLNRFELIKPTTNLKTQKSSQTVNVVTEDFEFGVLFAKRELVLGLRVGQFLVRVEQLATKSAQLTLEI